MNRIDRLQAILIQLQTKKVVKAKEIAQRFDISLRTVYRDIRALEEGGVPIGAEAGIGYFLNDNYSLPPIMFTTKEARALLLAGKLLPHLSDKQIDDAFQGALYKIKAVMPSEEKQAIAKLELAVRVYSDANVSSQKDSLFLQEIQQALIDATILEIRYFSHYSQQISVREIEPIGLVFYAMNWHLIAWCRLRSGYRDFRLDRIQYLKPTNEVYNRKLDLAFEAYIKAQKEQNDFVEITLKVKLKDALFLKETKYWYGFVTEFQERDTLVLTFLNAELQGFARWILTLGTKVEIEKPKKLKLIVEKLASQLYKRYV